MFLIYAIVSWIISQGSTLIRKRQNQYSLLLNLNRKKIKKINIKYGDIQIRQHWKVNFLGCLMDGEVMSGEVMAFNIIHKINNKLKFFIVKIFFLTLKLTMHVALMKSHFHYAYSAWYLNLIKKL